MSLPEDKRVSLETFYNMRKEMDYLLEYSDGVVFMSPSPSTRHQQVSGRLQARLFNFLDGGKCQVFSAPYDIHLYRDDLQETKIFIPDLSVICDVEGLEENRFVGVPELIVEILSPSNQSLDLVTKMQAYMKYGVKEYWVVNPMLDAILIYALTDEQVYNQVDVMKGQLPPLR
ncbi:Endonuclease, Uma2 family (restriction endonuclease fold) [Mesobacillus persicus]|uniref:Endonuclease, Uma2 family (Restriction endonuclease fold) n=1 Tax=Mesobacillus persicus TaxID=930146 RepID=A0A1H8EJN4_9BACI|nr:Uma2 family endonuclease [Mesobacillus persicus]SEN19606.1 Endonuclease, Uma2 family (restriction endonuclease fold) [Mesobacillus persicus]